MRHWYENYHRISLASCTIQYLIFCFFAWQDYELHIVDRESMEHMEVEILFHETLRQPMHVIRKIERIQNPHQWKSYQL